MEKKTLIDKKKYGAVLQDVNSEYYVVLMRKKEN